MKAVIYILSSIFICILTSCNEDVDFVAYEPQIVVEGRIENGEYASVLLSTSASFTESMDTINLLNHAIRNAKVTISDGTSTEVLLLKTNHQKIPPYEYVTTDMKGEVGKYYSLTIQYYEKTITATTSIPQPVEMDSLWFKKKSETDRTGYIHIQFKNLSDHNYQVSTQEIPDEKTFIPCLYGNIDRTLYSKGETVSMQINKGPVIFPETSYTTYFPDSVPIKVKLSTQTQESYEFWTSYQNEILNSQNPIFPAANKLKSNIRGGVGIWAGYGSSVRIISGKKGK